MGILDTFRNEFIDIIEWTDNTQDTIVWKFPRHQNEIKTGAQLTVRESQVAIFLNEGKLADVYQPGRYELTTANMPDSWRAPHEDVSQEGEPVSQVQSMYPTLWKGQHNE